MVNYNYEILSKLDLSKYLQEFTAENLRQADKDENCTAIFIPAAAWIEFLSDKYSPRLTDNFKASEKHESVIEGNLGTMGNGTTLLTDSFAHPHNKISIPDKPMFILVLDKKVTDKLETP